MARPLLLAFQFFIPTAATSKHDEHVLLWFEVTHFGTWVFYLGVKINHTKSKILQVYRLSDLDHLDIF